MEFITNNLTAIAIIFTTLVSLIGASIGLVWKIAMWKKGADKDLRGFSKFIEEVRDDIKKILWALHPDSRPIERNSPLRLTEYGKKMANEMKADEILVPYISPVVEAAKGKTLYGIQEQCLQFARHDLMENLRAANPRHADSLEMYAFQKGINLSEALEVLGVVLRDKVFDHLNLQLEE